MPKRRRLRVSGSTRCVRQGVAGPTCSGWLGQEVRRNGGSAGVDGETIADIESSGVDGWLGELARDLKEGTYRPNAVRPGLIPKKPGGKLRPLGIPCGRDRVAQTAARWVLSPIFEADLAPEQYAYRPGRSAGDAVQQVHRLVNRGHREVVDADLRDYFGQIPQAEQMKVRSPPHQGWAGVGWDQGMAGDGGGGRGRPRRPRPKDPGTARAERHSARGSHLSAAEQLVPATLHFGLEGVGATPAASKRRSSTTRTTLSPWARLRPRACGRWSRIW